MRFEYNITEYCRGTRDNSISLDIPDNELEDLARECDSREEFEDKLRDWLYDCEWDNVDDVEDEVTDTDDSEHCDNFYDCISEACDKFFGDDTTDDVDSRRRRRL
jgi:hypothetical protein